MCETTTFETMDCEDGSFHHNKPVVEDPLNVSNPGLYMKCYKCRPEYDGIQTDNTYRVSQLREKQSVRFSR